MYTYLSCKHSCGVIEPWAAIIIGSVAGVLYLWSSDLLVRLCIDDAVDAIPVHGFGGLWGLIATGLFASPGALGQYFGTDHFEHVGWFYSFGRGSGDAALLACQLIALICILFWVCATMLPFFLLLNYWGLFRSDGLEELVGLDASYHDWTPVKVKEEVSERHIQEYMKKNRKKRGDRFREDAEEEDGEQDLGGVDRFAG